MTSPSSPDRAQVSAAGSESLAASLGRDRAPNPSPSGAQWSIASGDYRATIVEVGGGLRELTHRGRPIISGYPQGERCDACRGQQLIPWPNRIADGTYTYAGVDHQLAITEPDRGTAIHGLLTWTNWTAVEQQSHRVVVAATLRPQQGWDWTFDVRISYDLSADGLTVTPEVTNLSDSPAPFGYSAHPYLTAGEARVDDVQLVLPASEYLVVDPVRLLRTATSSDDRGTAGVTGEGSAASGNDIRAAGQPLGSRQLDTAYTGLTADADGNWRSTLTDPASGRSTTLWAPLSDYPWAQVFSGDALPAQQRRTTGIAVEPMTCPPQAFETGQNLIHLAPGETWSAPWGISAAG